MSTSQLFNLAAKTPAKIDIEEQPPALKSPKIPKVYQNESKWLIFRKECTTCPSSPHHIPITCILFLCENQPGCAISAFLLYLHGPFPMCQSAPCSCAVLVLPIWCFSGVLFQGFIRLPWHKLCVNAWFKAQTPKGIQVLAENRVIVSKITNLLTTPTLPPPWSAAIL